MWNSCFGKKRRNHWKQESNHHKNWYLGIRSQNNHVLKPTYGGSKKTCAKIWLEVDCNVGFSMDVVC